MNTCDGRKEREAGGGGGWGYEIMEERKSQLFLYKLRNASLGLLGHLSSGEGVTHGSVGCKGEDGDEDRSCGPEIHTQSIQVLPPSQPLQLCSSSGNTMSIRQSRECDISAIIYNIVIRIFYLIPNIFVMKLLSQA